MNHKELAGKFRQVYWGSTRPVTMETEEIKLLLNQHRIWAIMIDFSR